LNHSCLDSCPPNYEINNGKCIIKSFDSDITANDFKDLIKNDIKSLKEPPLGDRYLKICKNIDLAIKESEKYLNFADFANFFEK